MGGLGDFYGAALNGLLGSGHASFMSDPLYLALYTVAPADFGGGTEVFGGSYARAAIPNDDAHWNVMTRFSSYKINVADFVFPAVPTAAWGTIVAFGLHYLAGFDSLVIWGETPHVAVVPGFSVLIPSGSIQITIA